jgi:hypothetical protein
MSHLLLFVSLAPSCLSSPTTGLTETAIDYRGRIDSEKSSRLASKCTFYLSRPPRRLALFQLPSSAHEAVRTRSTRSRLRPFIG